ncbi:hypothetical protein FMUND_2515 [Fusarium mundagurra]|uniref:Uncharacterized protein n=1 Tax=Fusarium mundagurra TaxID=1567541 RepID=A0A8H5Z488_9HYPO|nr:hypothetical protein FMUND_2515 [Fusarium mundagurra]
MQSPLNYSPSHLHSPSWPRAKRPQRTHTQNWAATRPELALTRASGSTTTLGSLDLEHFHSLDLLTSPQFTYLDIDVYDSVFELKITLAATTRRAACPARNPAIHLFTIFHLQLLTPISLLLITRKDRAYRLPPPTNYISTPHTQQKHQHLQHHQPTETTNNNWNPSTLRISRFATQRNAQHHTVSFAPRVTSKSPK